MRTTLTAMTMAVLLATAAIGFTACEKKGPAEKAGDKIDKAVEKVGDAIDPKGPVEKAGRKIDKALDNDN